MSGSDLESQTNNISLVDDIHVSCYWSPLSIDPCLCIGSTSFIHALIERLRDHQQMLETNKCSLRYLTCVLMRRHEGDEIDYITAHEQRKQQK